MGVRLLEDLTEALGFPGPDQGRLRLAEADLPVLFEAVAVSGVGLVLEPCVAAELIELVRAYDGRLVTLASWLEVTLPPWGPLES